MYLAIVLFAIFFGCFAMLFNNGLWTNTLILVNVLTAGLIAMNYFEPLASFFDKQEPSLTYVWDFVAIWLMFGVAMTVLRVATDFASMLKVKFFMPVEKAGGVVDGHLGFLGTAVLHDRYPSHGPIVPVVPGRGISSRALLAAAVWHRPRLCLAGLDASRVEGVA